jgi:choline dehydrogenase
MEFDFIIIGAGSAGCALADALTKSGRYRVLILEAGGTDQRFWVQVPLGYGRIFYDPSLNWKYEAEPDPGLGGRQDYWPRGKIVGGSSSINAMVYIRGGADDFNDWAAAGNVGWSWNDVLPVFRSMEDSDVGASDYRGVGGKLHVSEVSDRLHPLARIFLRACREAGLPSNSDFNGPSQEGAGLYQITTKGGARMSAARAFLTPARRRANLTLRTRALVTRITMDGARATGVAWAEGSRRLTATARCEIILSGGTVNSPQVLQLSGIGPSEVLRRLGIGVVVDNSNVGANLQDHVGINYYYGSRIPTLNHALRPWWGKLLAGAQYILARSGPLSLSLNQAGGFFRTRPDLPRPNMQLYLQAISTLTARRQSRPLLNPDPFEAFALGLSNCHPKSRGNIMLKSPDPFVPPAITANAYGAEEDVTDMLDAVKFLRKLASMPAFAAVITEELSPGTKVATDADMIADLRARSGTVFHPACTCRMGPDPVTSVVDPRLRVHGVTGLRVADASIFPSLITGNTNAAAMMVGVKAASLILEDTR